MSDRNRVRIVEILEKRVLFTRIDVGDFGAAPGDGRDDLAAVEAAVAAAKPGDTVVFGEGRYDLGGMLRLGSNLTIEGAGRLDTTLKFNVGDDGWGIKVVADSSDLTVQNFVLDGGGVSMTEGTLFKDVTIRNNEFVNTPGGTFNGNGPAIFSGSKSDGLTITGNYIHDRDKYGLILFGVDRLTVANNTFKNLHQAAHILDVGKDVNVSFNRLVGMVRMGIEMQRKGARVAENLLVEGNVLSDWRTPWHNSFGLSIVPDGSINTRVINNYIQGVPSDYDGAWHEKAGSDGQRPRMGYGIEYGARSGEVRGNVIGGAWANHVIVSGGGGKHDSVIRVRDNKLYGEPIWRDWVTQESFGGEGFGWRDTGNVKDADYENMPAAPTRTREPRKEEPKGERDDDRGADAPRESMFEPGTFAWVSNLPRERAASGWGPVETDRSNGERARGDGHAMKLNGRAYEKGLGVAIDSEIVYDIGGKYEKFFSHVGIDDQAGDAGSVTFEVWADGRRIYDSGRMTGAMSGRAVELGVTGVEELKLVTTDAGDGGSNDHANWAGAKLVLTDPAPAETAPAEASTKAS